MKKRSKLFIVFVLFGLNNSNAQIISTIAGTGVLGYTGDGGLAINALLYRPSGVCADTANNVYVADEYNNVIRMINYSTGIITTIAGTGISGFSGDGGQAINAQFDNPYGIAIDRFGNLYIADYWNSRIRKITKSTGIITTIAGTGIASYSGDGGLATNADINFAGFVAVDTTGNIYIADYFNKRIRKVTASNGIISTIAGIGVSGSSGDGGLAINATLNDPTGVCVDTYGNVYFSDYFNNKVRKIDATTGIISTLAGNGTLGYSGDGGAAVNAKLGSPFGVAADKFGNIYIADYNNSVIRKVNALGIISTHAGNGTQGYSGDGGLAINAQLKIPTGVYVQNNGDVLVADYDNNVIRKISGLSTGLVSNNSKVELNYYPNPTSGELYVNSSQEILVIEVYNNSGQQIVHLKDPKTNFVKLNFDELQAGFYFMHIQTYHSSIVRKVIKE